MRVQTRVRAYSNRSEPQHIAVIHARGRLGDAATYATDHFMGVVGDTLVCLSYMGFGPNAGGTGENRDLGERLIELIVSKL
jgi:hypothetical protein